MKREIILCLCLFLGLDLFAQDVLSALMPMPNKVEVGKGRPFSVESSSAIGVNSMELSFAAEKLKAVFNERMGLELGVSTTSKERIWLEIDTTIVGREHYIIDIDHKSLILKGNSPEAVYYAVTTLDQLLMGDVVSTSRRVISEIKIDDMPRFPFRALMLDPARNFLSVEDVKFFIDKMSYYKFNVLQLHLTDDQGWRVKIDKYPMLASKECYTKDDIKELVDYAALRNVNIVPEIDVPGHTVAMLSVFPELGCKCGENEGIEVGKTVNRMLCAANDRVYSVLYDVFDEVNSMFPSPYIHLGGDEAAIGDNWAKCGDCKTMMSELGYTAPSQLMIPFFGKILDKIRENGKRPILWCELDNIYPPAKEYLFPYPKDVVLVTWRNGLTPKCTELTGQSGNSLIMAPGEYAYLDYPQYKGDLPEFNNWGMPITTLEKCYQLDPGYGLPCQDQKHIRGVMGTLWGEAIKDINRATYMAYPRCLALAEAGWTGMEHRDWRSFKRRMYPNLLYLMEQGVSFRVPFEIVEERF